MNYGDLARLGNKISEAINSIGNNFGGVDGLKNNGFNQQAVGADSYWTAPTTAATLASQAGIEMGLEVGAGGVLTATAISASEGAGGLAVEGGMLAEFGGGVATGLGYGVVATLLAYMGYKLTETVYLSDKPYWDGVIEDILGTTPHAIFYGDKLLIPEDIVQRAYDFAATLSSVDDVIDTQGNPVPVVITNGYTVTASGDVFVTGSYIPCNYNFTMSITDGFFIMTRTSTGISGYYFGAVPFRTNPSVAPTITLDYTYNRSDLPSYSVTLTSNDFPIWGQQYSWTINGNTYRRSGGISSAHQGIPDVLWNSITSGHKDLINGSREGNIITVVPNLPATSYSIDTIYPVTVTTQSTSLLEEIAGAVHPVDAGTIATSYPDWWRWQMTQNIGVDEAGNPVIDNTMDKVLVPVIPVSDTFIENATAADVIAAQDVGTLTLEDILAMVGEAVADLIAEGTAAASQEAIESEGTNPQAPDPVDTGGTVKPIAVVGGALSDTGFVAIYHPSKSQLRQLNSWLWSVGFDLDTFKKMFQDPMEAIISLHQIYITPVDAGDTTIVVGYIDSHVSSKYITDTVISLNCGTVNIGAYYNNALDCNGYTEIDAYLPFIGFRTLSINDINKAAVNITYNIDVVTGACVALITIKKQGIDAIAYAYNGNCAVEIPMSSANFANMLTSLATAVVSGGAAMVTGSPALGVGAAASALHGKLNVERSGNIASNVGAISPKKPYLVIRRPVAKMAYQYQKFMGFPASSNIKLSSCHGFTKVQEIILNNVSATEQEKNELSEILKAGVIM